MKLSRTVGYALQAVLQLADAEPDTPVPCSRLASEGHMPERFLLQILRSLVTHDILNSTRGVDGGYMLKRRVEEVSLLELIEAVDGPLNAQSPTTEGLPADSMEKLSAALADICGVAKKHLASVKLSSLMPRSRKAHSADYTRRKTEEASIGN